MKNLEETIEQQGFKVPASRGKRNPFNINAILIFSISVITLIYPQLSGHSILSTLPDQYELWGHLLTFLCALFLSLYGTPRAREAALRYNIVDKPDGRLKVQKHPVPYLGGMAIYLAFLLTISLTFQFDQRVLGLILAGSMVVILGLFDDLGALTPQVKFLGQCLAVVVLIKSGIVIEIGIFPDWLKLTLTVFWMLGIINAINIIDIMDGLASGVAFFASLILFGVAYLNGADMIATLTMGLAGSLLGFLRYNFQPAQIYLGDTGSMFIGLMLGALAMIGSYSSENSLALLSPVLILGVPIFDTLFVMYLRWRKGRSMFLGSKDHYALRCRALGWSVKQVVLVSYGVTVILGLIALWLIQQTSEVLPTFVLVILGLLTLVVARRLSHVKMD
ncbi:MAG TPA: MraY family glycosyltransferase [Candidatus Limnocylindrales bacterium]|nr:MraY family glycosyltransferase [Candidatus Limnocylindrales bacterium]